MTNPQLQVRLSPSLLAYIESQGGQDYVRTLLVRDAAKHGVAVAEHAAVALVALQESVRVRPIPKRYVRKPKH